MSGPMVRFDTAQRFSRNYWDGGRVPESRAPTRWSKIGYSDLNVAVAVYYV
jgi:hypothetical protein